MIYDARHTVKQKPLQAIGVVFAAGVLAGSLIGWLSALELIADQEKRAAY